MCAKTLCPFASSTRNMAFGSDSTTDPSISIAPSFFGMSSAFLPPPSPPGGDRARCWLGSLAQRRPMQLENGEQPQRARERGRRQAEDRVYVTEGPRGKLAREAPVSPAAGLPDRICAGQRVRR